jgi:hypothetical protein
MNKIVTVTACALAAWLFAVPAGSENGQIRIGVGSLGPISPQTETDIDRMVDALPNVKAVPIQPPGDVAACVKRFVAGEADDHLDGVMVVSLPPDSFQTERDSKEAKFSGAYEIWTLNLSTLAEDRHRFTFPETEPVIGAAAAILSIPAQFFAERATGQKLISTSEWQAYEKVQARVEAKLLAATRLYLATAPVRETGSLNALETAQHLLDSGDGETAMLVFKSVGMNNPEVQRLMGAAQQQLKRTYAEALLGRMLGALAGGNPGTAATILAEYEKAPAAETARASAIQTALDASSDHRAESAYERVLRNDVPALDHTAFVAMVKQLFNEATGSAPQEVLVSAKDLTIEDKNAPQGLKTALDSYASAVGKSAWLMSMKCGCDAAAALTAEPVGTTLLRARSAPSFKRPQVGLP